MAAAAAISVLTLGTRGNATSFRSGTTFTSVFSAGSTGSRTAATIAVLTLEQGPNVTPIVYDLLTTIISGSNCPPVPQVPLTGQRYPGYYELS